MIFQIPLASIALVVENIKWIIISFIIFAIGIFNLRWYARKRHKPHEKIWDRTLKTSFKVNIIWLIISILIHILLNFLFTESIFFDLVVSIINIFIGTILVMFLYKKEFVESVLCVAIVQSILFVIVLLLWLIFYLISIPPYIFLFIIGVGLPNTLVLTALGLIWGFLIGIILAIMRVYGGKELVWLSSGYEKLFRGIPLLVLIY
ncbi:MAG: ABC transporter permease subunit, partial [Promethearchaeota archaeon]